MREISLHILDIAENSVNAGSTVVKITINENLNNDELSIKIEDNGKGMDDDTVRKITDPFVTTRTTRKVGLGIPFLKAAAEACQGGLEITSAPGKGTVISVKFQHSHIDRMPLGDIQNSLLSLIVGYPDVRWIFSHQVNGKEFLFDTEPVREILGEIPFSEPKVIQYLKQTIFQGIDGLTVRN